MGKLRYISLFFLASLLWHGVAVYAATLEQGYYEAEACIAPNCSFSGTWSVVVDGARSYVFTSTNASAFSFTAKGKTLLIYRASGVGSGTMTVCVGASCTAVTNSSSTSVLSYPVAFALTGGTDTVTVTATSSSPFYIDSWMILDAPYIPPPTATAGPTATPGASPTPSGTATPDSGLVISVQPECRYENLGGEIVSICYTITGGDIGVIIFLAFLTAVIVGLVLVVQWRPKHG